MARDGNGAHRRIFTFGVGADVNTPLLNALATESRAAATFVLNDKEVDEKIAAVFERLCGPVMADPRLTVVDAQGRPAPGAVMDVIPERLPDLFKGDQLVVLGRYVADSPLTFELTGDFRGRVRTFRFAFAVDNASTKNGFVPRLWASRRIGVLTDAIRQAGVDSPPAYGGMFVATAATDPRARELVEEVVRLSTEFGVMTEYTAFLALEGSDLSSPDAVLRQAQQNFDRRAGRVRSGIGSVNQEMNIMAQANQSVLNHANYFNDKNLNRVSVNAVRQVGDRAFYQRHGRWVDSSYVANAQRAAPREVRFGTSEYFALANQLANDGRQGAMALNGDILLNVDGRAVLVCGPAGR
jgi:Ca-activated chloride channel family protein